MYIITIKHKDSIPVVFRSDKAFVEVDTLEQAEKVYRDIISEYPFSTDVKVYKTEEIEMPSEILENAINEKTKLNELIIAIKRQGININELCIDDKNDIDTWHDIFVKSKNKSL